MAGSTRRTSVVAGHGLTPREIDVLGLMAQGLSNRQIAAHLYVSQHTVLGYVKTIFAKLGVHTRVEAVVKGLAARAIPMPRDAVGDGGP
jgi:DNA-binding CsgD family transcriptional regulator